jgi:O-acetyl-ADP-ribose deacetylase (regulator of RNase III)
MIKFIAGDILRAPSQYIAIDVATDSEEGMFTGLAMKVSSKWPDVQRHFKQFTRGNKFQGGELFVVSPGKNRPGIIYIAIQPYLHNTSSPFLNGGLRKLARYCVKHKVESVSLPRIGAGLVDVDWENETRPLLVKYFEGAKTMFYVYDDQKQKQ